MSSYRSMIPTCSVRLVIDSNAGKSRRLENDNHTLSTSRPSPLQIPAHKSYIERHPRQSLSKWKEGCDHGFVLKTISLLSGLCHNPIERKYTSTGDWLWEKLPISGLPHWCLFTCLADSVKSKCNFSLWAFTYICKVCYTCAFEACPFGC